MNKQTAEALEKSIEKWRGIARREREEGGTDDCALCELFHHRGCRGCPVRKHTRLDSCSGTPYTYWSRLYDREGDYVAPANYTDEMVAAALEEVKFLESLRVKR